MWRLIVAEDSDDYLRASARRDAGAGLSRLLNLTDGILGQGFNVLVLITTNEELLPPPPSGRATGSVPGEGRVRAPLGPRGAGLAATGTVRARVPRHTRRALRGERRAQRREPPADAIDNWAVPVRLVAATDVRRAT